MKNDDNDKEEEERDGIGKYGEGNNGFGKVNIELLEKEKQPYMHVSTKQRKLNSSQELMINYN